MSMAHLNELFDGVKSSLGMTGVGLDEHGACTIRLQAKGTPAIHLAYDAENDVLDIFAEIGFVPDEDAGLYREFLEANLFGTETRQATYAVDAATGQVVLHRSVSVAALEKAEDLEAELTSFVATACEGRLKIYRKITGRQEQGEVSTGGFMKV